MAKRRRYISTKMSSDKMLNKLALEHGDFAVLLYTWLIPHAEDDCTLPTDPEEILMTVMPGRRDKTPENIAEAIQAIVSLGLLEYNNDGILREKPKTFYEYQSYISKNNRLPENTGNFYHTPQNAEEHRGTPQNASSFSPSFSPTPSFSSSFPPDAGVNTHARTHEEQTGILPKQVFGSQNNVYLDEGEILGLYSDHWGKETVDEAIEWYSLYKPTRPDIKNSKDCDYVNIRRYAINHVLEEREKLKRLQTPNARAPTSQSEVISGALEILNKRKGETRDDSG